MDHYIHKSGEPPGSEHQLWADIVPLAQNSRATIVDGCEKTADYDRSIQVGATLDSISTPPTLSRQPMTAERLIKSVADCGTTSSGSLGLITPAKSYDFTGIRKDLVRLIAVDDDIAVCASVDPSVGNVRAWKQTTETFRRDLNTRFVDLNAMIQRLGE